MHEAAAGYLQSDHLNKDGSTPLFRPAALFIPVQELPGSLTFTYNCTHKIPTVLFRTEPQSAAMYVTELFPSFLVHGTPLQTPHVPRFQTSTNYETLLLYSRTNEPIDRFNYTNSYTVLY